MKFSIGQSILVVTSNTDKYRKWSGNKGYDDELGNLYDFDDAVALWHRIQLGSILVVSRDSHVAGIGVVHELKASQKLKEYFSCPSCGKQKLSQKSGGYFSCTDCKKSITHDQRIVSVKPVTRLQAAYSQVWLPATKSLASMELMPLMKTQDTQSAIRELEPKNLELLCKKLGVNSPDLRLP